MSRLGSVDFDLVRGDSFAVTLNFTDADGVAYDVSGWSFIGQVRSDPDSTTTLADFTFDLSTAADGTVIAQLAPEDTATFEGRFVCYDIQLTTDTNFVRTAPRGRLNMIKDVTRG